MRQWTGHGKKGKGRELRSGARTPDGPWSLYEGWGGTLCFYADLLEVGKAEFPLYPPHATP